MKIQKKVKLWNNGVTIQELTKNLYCSYFFNCMAPIILLQTMYDILSNNLDVWEEFYPFYYYRVQYDHKTEQKSGSFREDGVMTSAAFNQSDIILFQNDLIISILPIIRQATCTNCSFIIWGTKNYGVHLCIHVETENTYKYS